MRENGLVLEHVSKSFANGGADGLTYALEDINLRVEPGEFVSVVGPSGCGKSTILRLVAGLIPPTTGQLRLKGEPICGPHPNRGMAFQKPTLFPWLTVQDNVSFSLRMQGKKERLKEKTGRLLRAAGLEEFGRLYPHQLSGGMAQRVSLIRTMINNPEVFLLDEPLGALDAFTRMNMQDEILKMRRDGQIVLLVTHDIDEAVYLGSRVLVMAPRPGRIREDIAIDLEYPRNRTSARFLKYRNKVMEMLNFGYAETATEAEAELIL